jgi:hypothetical protein
MYNSIQQFNQFGVKNIEKIIGNFIEQENHDIADLVIGLQKPLQELQCMLISETIESLDKQLRKSSERKENWSIVRSNDCNMW